MANLGKRISVLKCFVFVLIFAVATFFMETTKLLDVKRNAVLAKRSVNDYLSGGRDRIERTLKVATVERNTTVVSAAESVHVSQSNSTTFGVDNAAGIALQDLFNVWDRRTRKKGMTETGRPTTLLSDGDPFLALQNNGTTSTVDKAEGISMQDAFNVWDGRTRNKGMAELQNEGNTSECFKLSVLPTNPKLHRSDEKVKVAFYEGHRKAWIYKQLFNKPPETRFCDKCNFETNHPIRVKLEKSASNLKSYDIVIFPHDKGTKQIKRSTWRKILYSAPSHQRRVYATFEGPFKLINIKSKRRQSLRRGEFHWSWTFNTKSEFTMPYGYYHKFTDMNSETSIKEVSAVNWAEGKTNFVAWMSSWVDTNWKRTQFVEKLSKFIPVHKYGKKYRDCPKGSQSCDDKIKGYKFYLALENSCCGEYISEKFWRTLDWGIIPIVVGAPRKDYERLAPPNSFIFVDDFKSLKDLANYLIKIDKNDTLYNEFFRWRTQGEVHQNYPNYRRGSRKTPKTWFYSCNAVCKVTEKYLRERKEFVEPGSGFDPHSEWWGRSCRKCGSQPWFEEFRT